MFISFYNFRAKCHCTNWCSTIITWMDTAQVISATFLHGETSRAAHMFAPIAIYLFHIVSLLSRSTTS